MRACTATLCVSRFGNPGRSALLPRVAAAIWCFQKHREKQEQRNEGTARSLGGLQVLEAWPRAAAERGLEHLQAAAVTAAADPVEGVRTTGRRLFGALAHRFPERGHVALDCIARRDPVAASRLRAAIAAYVPGAVQAFPCYAMVLTCMPSPRSPVSEMRELSLLQCQLPTGRMV